jgi:hypothetical protein
MSTRRSFFGKLAASTLAFLGLNTTVKGCLTPSELRKPIQQELIDSAKNNLSEITNKHQITCFNLDQKIEYDNDLRRKRTVMGKISGYNLETSPAFIIMLNAIKPLPRFKRESSTYKLEPIISTLDAKGEDILYWQSLSFIAVDKEIVVEKES